MINVSVHLNTREIVNLKFVGQKIQSKPQKQHILIFSLLVSLMAEYNTCGHMCYIAASVTSPIFGV